MGEGQITFLHLLEGDVVIRTMENTCGENEMEGEKEKG